MSLKSRAALFIAAALASSAAAVQGAVLATYDFTGMAGTEASKPVTSAALTVNAGAITRSSTLNPATAANALSSSNFSTTGVFNSSMTSYYTVSIAPTAGNSLNLDTLAFGARRSGAGPVIYDIRSSLDGYGATLGQFGVAETSNTNISVPLGSAFDALSATTTFRIYGYGAGSTPGTGRLINGTSGGLVFSGSTAVLNAAPVVSIVPNVVTVDVAPAGLEGFSGVVAAAVDADGSISSFAPGAVPAQIADNILITAGTVADTFEISGSGFTYADIGTYTINFTATDNGTASTSQTFTLNVVPEPTTLGVLASAATFFGRRRR